MQSPKCSKRKSRRRFGKDEYAERVDQGDVNSVQCKIDPMIASATRTVTQDRVIQQIRKGSDRPIQAGSLVHVPILPGQDRLDVLRCSLPDAWVLLNHVGAVEQQTRCEGIRVSGKDQYPKGQQAPSVAMPDPIRSLCSGGLPCRPGCFSRRPPLFDLPHY